jgi:hypothetical protein
MKDGRVCRSPQTYTTLIMAKELAIVENNNRVAWTPKLMKELPVSISAPNFREGQYMDRNGQMRPMIEVSLLLWAALLRASRRRKRHESDRHHEGQLFASGRPRRRRQGIRAPQHCKRRFVNDGIA